MRRVFLCCLFFVLIPVLFTACSHQKAAVKKEQADAARNLGEAYMAEGSYTRALRELLKAEQMNPNDPYLMNDLGLVYLAKDNPEKAVDHFKRAVKLKPDYSPARNNLGSAYIALEEWEKAIECFDRVKDDLLYATPYYPLTNLGYIHFRKGQYDKAIAYYQQALDLKTDFPKALHGLGQVYMARGQYEKAIEKLERAIKIVPKAARLHLDLGRAYEGNHEYNKALNAYKKTAAMAAGTQLAQTAENAADVLRNQW